MGSLSDYSENALLGHIFGSAYSHVATIYLALCTADPTDAGTGASMSEVPNSNNYSRKAISFGSASSRRITQDAIVNFDQASGAWGTITHWALVDSGTHGAGNMLAHGQFSTSFAPVSGNTPSVASGQVYVEITAGGGTVGMTTYLANKLLDFMFDNVDYAQPSTYIALLNSAGADADDDPTAKEISGTSYARQLVNKAGGSVPKWAAVSGGALDNADEVSFGTVGAGGWSQVVGACLVDAVSTGHALMYDNTNIVDQTPAAGDTVKFAAGAFDISLS